MINNNGEKEGEEMIQFLIGLLIGGTIGVFSMCLLMVYKDDD